MNNTDYKIVGLVKFHKVELTDTVFSSLETFFGDAFEKRKDMAYKYIVDKNFDSLTDIALAKHYFKLGFLYNYLSFVNEED